METRVLRTAAFMFLLLLYVPCGHAAQSEAARRGDLARLATTGTLRGSNQNKARENMVAMATQIQALYDIGGKSEATADDRNEIERHSDELEEAVSSLLNFLRQVGAPGQEAEPASIPGESYDRRTRRLVDTYLGLSETLTEFINGETLDNAVLGDLQAGLARIQALTAALPDSEF